MAHYFFVKDFKDGKIAESVVAEHFRSKAYNVEELPKARQIEGDLEVFGRPDEQFTVEVKFDRMAKETGNLCFEITNKKGDLTGIASTLADKVVYIVPKSDISVVLFCFDTKALKEYLYDEANISKIKSVKGGDRKAYSLLLVPITTIIEDGLAYEMETISAELPI